VLCGLCGCGGGILCKCCCLAGQACLGGEQHHATIALAAPDKPLIKQ
jgi:hypothetical protein